MWHAVALVAPKRGIAVATVSNDETDGAAVAQALAQTLVGTYAPA